MRDDLSMAILWGVTPSRSGIPGSAYRKEQIDKYGNFSFGAVLFWGGSGLYFPAPALKPATALKVEDIVLKKSFLELFKKCLK